MSMKKIHPLLKYMRAHKPPISLRKAAKDLGCHFTNIQAIITRRHKPSPDLAKKIKKWSDGKVGFDELYGG